ncbi:MAG: hypothetical protein RBG13Loki_2799 [Promethearchaeota archaeon CR_4]|nr:MAG: hypothetical protein RBG13Loki_2799 [Candidatus Lokiarchaeota archaeon CR_4]
MANKKSIKKNGASKAAPGYSNTKLVAYCGLNCKNCKAKSQQRLQLATRLKENLQELPLELFSQILPPFKNIKQVMEFLEFLPQMGAQTCCTAETSPCGNPNCEIRACVKEKGFRTCAECVGYPTCAKLNFLKPFHPNLITDLDFIKEKGFDHYVDEVISKFKLQQVTIK